MPQNEMQQNSHWENDNFHQISIYRQTAKAAIAAVVAAAAAAGGDSSKPNS